MQGGTRASGYDETIRWTSPDIQCEKTSAPTMLKTGVGKRRDLTDTALYQEVSHEQEVYRPTFG